MDPLRRIYKAICTAKYRAERELAIYVSFSVFDEILKACTSNTTIYYQNPQTPHEQTLFGVPIYCVADDNHGWRVVDIQEESPNA